MKAIYEDTIFIYPFGVKAFFKWTLIWFTSRHTLFPVKTSLSILFFFFLLVEMGFFHFLTPSLPLPLLLILSFDSAAKSMETSQEVAIKKVTKIFDKPILAKRALRELKLLRHFNGHENVRILFPLLSSSLSVPFASSYLFFLYNFI